MIWIVFALMTGAAVLGASWPLLRSRKRPDGAASTIAFYKEQIAEIERDLARGQLPAAEAAGARTEAARRLLAASERSAVGGDVAPQTSGRRRAAAAAIVIAVPLAAFALYAQIGSPSEPDEPLIARAADPTRTGDLAAAVAKVEAHLIAHPEDGRGFKVIAPAYVRLGRFNEAVRAYDEALRLLGEDADTRADYGEALVAAAGGIVTGQARAAFDRALSEKADIPKARYYAALAIEQEGDKARAAQLYQKLLADAPPNAAWAPVVRDHLAGLSDASASAKVEAPPASEASAIATLDPEKRQEAIRGMVDRLAARLESNGDDPAGWLRLIRAYSVLQQMDKAKAALAKAREALNGNEGAERDLDALAKELGLEG